MNYEAAEDLVEFVGVIVEVFGVAVIAVGIIMATYRFLRGEYTHYEHRPLFRYRVDLGLALLLGLEILVAADIIESVAIDPSFDSLGILAALVGIRTFLGWAIVLEIEQKWPWQTAVGKDKTTTGSPDEAATASERGAWAE